MSSDVGKLNTVGYRQFYHHLSRIKTFYMHDCHYSNQNDFFKAVYNNEQNINKQKIMTNVELYVNTSLYTIKHFLNFLLNESLWYSILMRQNLKVPTDNA